MLTMLDFTWQSVIGFHRTERNENGAIFTILQRSSAIRLLFSVILSGSSLVALSNHSMTFIRDSGHVGVYEHAILLDASAE
jgi:hypothetical protein